MAIDPLHNEIQIIKATFPELWNVKDKWDAGHWSFMIRNMALAYKLAVQNTLANIQTKIGQA